MDQSPNLKLDVRYLIADVHNKKPVDRKLLGSNQTLTAISDNFRLTLLVV